jgi:EmrB/QacA subfamily drug resistance transporter
MSFTSSSLNVALPAISHEFAANAILLSWIISVPALAAAVFLVPFGRIADIVGIKKLFAYGMTVITAGSALAVFSNSTIMLIICQALQGIGGAMLIGNSMAMITAIYPAKERGRALGINLACLYAGGSIGPFLGGVLTEHLGWRSIFFFNIPAGVAVVLILTLKIRGDWCESKGEKFDYIGSIIYGIALIVLVYGFSVLPGIPGAILILIGIVGLLAFFKRETGNKSPVLDLSIFRDNRVFIFSTLAALISYCAVFAVSFLVSLYLQYIKGFSPQQAGLVLVAQPLMQAISAPFTGRLSDRIEPRIVTTAGIVLTCTVLFSLIFLTKNTSLIHIVIALALLGVGFGLFTSPNANAIMSSVVPKFYGIASATMNTVIGLGNTLSMGITMIVMATVIGRVVITPEYYSAFLTATRIAFGIFTALCFGGIFVSLFRGKVR